MPLAPGFVCLKHGTLIPEEPDTGWRAGCCCCMSVLPSGMAAGWQRRVNWRYLDSVSAEQLLICRRMCSNRKNKSCLYLCSFAPARAKLQSCLSAWPGAGSWAPGTGSAGRVSHLAPSQRRSSGRRILCKQNAAAGVSACVRRHQGKATAPTWFCNAISLRSCAHQRSLTCPIVSATLFVNRRSPAVLANM